MFLGKVKLVIMTTLCLVVISSAEKFSVITIPCWPREAAIDDWLDIAQEKGFNTVAIYVRPDAREDSRGAGYLASFDYRMDYKNYYDKVLSRDLNLIVRIDCRARNMIGVDVARQLKWEDNDYFLRHPPVPELNSGVTDLVKTTWVPDIDFYFESHRHRMLNFNNATVRSLTVDCVKSIVKDVVSAAKLKNKQNKIICFTINTTPSGESENWFTFYTGNDASGNYNSKFDLANNNMERIKWFDQWQNDLADFHGDLSDAVHAEKALAGTGFRFTFGAQLSGAHDIYGLTRGTSNLAKFSYAMNSGDWLNNADMIDTGWSEYNHNFSMDYYSSIANWRGLHSSNETSPWPSHAIKQLGNSTAAASAYLQMAKRSYNHGAEAFFVSNWPLAELSNPVYNNFLVWVADNFSKSNTFKPSRSDAILVDEWSIYAREYHNSAPVLKHLSSGEQNLFITQDVTGFGFLGIAPEYQNQIPTLYTLLKNRYNQLTNNGSGCTRIITSYMISKQPSIVNNAKNIWVPSLDQVITESAKSVLVKKANLKKLRLESLDAGSKNEYQAERASLSSYKSADILWVDKNNKYLPGLQVSKSLGARFSAAGLWCSWGGENGLDKSKGHFVGDFNGDGLDDFLNIGANNELQVVYSTGNSTFTTLKNWGSWNVNAADIRVGDFNGDLKDDLLWADKSNRTSPCLRVRLSTGSGFGTAKNWRSWPSLNTSKGFYTGDFNSDGRDDFFNLDTNYDMQVVTSSGVSFSVIKSWGSWGADGEDLRIGDFNGDGRDDVLWVDKNNKFKGDVSPEDYPGLQVSLSHGFGFRVATLWASWGGLNTSRGFYTGDFNGDGIDDFLNFADNYDLQVVLSNGIGNFFPLQNWGDWGVDGADLRIGNFNKLQSGLPKSAVAEFLPENRLQVALADKIEVKDISSGSITFKLPQQMISENVWLDIFDLSGKQVKRIKPTGSGEFYWDKRAANSKARSGLYFFQFRNKSQIVQLIKMNLVN